MEKELAEQVKLFSQSFAALTHSVQKLAREQEELHLRFGELAAVLERNHLAHRKSLAEEEALSLFLDNILETVQTGIVAVDQVGVITLFNREAERIAGLTAAEVLGQKYEKFFPVPLSVLETLAVGKPITGREKHLMNTEGKKIPLGVSIRRENGFFWVELSFKMPKDYTEKSKVKRGKKGVRKVRSGGR